MVKKFYNFTLCFLLAFSLQAQNINHALWTNFLQKYVSSDGNVDYKAIKLHPEELEIYLQELKRTTPKQNWIKEEKLAYWINAYNALTIDLILRNYPLKSIKDIKKPWKQRLWKLGDNNYNLEDIEHEILRKMNEPRIHFAIVCASVSCPKLQNEAFTASKIDSQLTKATEEFLADTDKNTLSEQRLDLSKIFQWFSKDFKQKGSLIEFLNKYGSIKISVNAKVTFKDYNWNLND